MLPPYKSPGFRKKTRALYFMKLDAQEGLAGNQRDASGSSAAMTLTLAWYSGELLYRSATINEINISTAARKNG